MGNEVIRHASIDQLIGEIGRLQGAIIQQKREIERTVERYSKEINDFLRNAGYNYTVSIEEAADHSYKLHLKFGDTGTTISGVKSHLSFGERNAFALVLFMYQAVYNQANFIILDDPISSFDTNKKFAILEMLFIRGGSLRGKTTLLLTHDFEPVIDTVYNHPGFFDRPPAAYFMENINGVLTERIIQKENILSSMKVAKENIQTAPHIVSKLIYLRRFVEITEGKRVTWHFLSNLFHKRAVPMIGADEREMSAEEIALATNETRQYIPGFDYAQALAMVTNREEMKRLYHNVGSNYEKLQVFRLLFDLTDQTFTLRKFLNETYHIENDYLFQLNPLEFNTIPNYIIAECDDIISADQTA